MNILIDEHVYLEHFGVNLTQKIYTKCAETIYESTNKVEII